MENAHITRPGYAIEYDYFDPRDLSHSLQTSQITGLFFAGQINGTTGYEEAAAQGLLAGVNAARLCWDLPFWEPRRDEAYIGVLIDDLVTLGTKEPYRMFTSRAEYRLQLRQDNADQRLTPIGRELGLVDDDHWQWFEQKREQIDSELRRLGTTYVQPGSTKAETLAQKLKSPLTREYSLLDLIKRPELTYGDVAPSETRPSLLSDDASEYVETQIKYEGYIARQQEEIDRLKRHEEAKIPSDFNYDNVVGLSNEICQKLNEARPANIARASRIPGMTPAALSLLLVYLQKQSAESRAAVANG